MRIFRVPSASAASAWRRRSALPRGKGVLALLDELAAVHYPIAAIADLGTPFRDHLNELQIRIAALHRQIAETWFTLS